MHATAGFNRELAGAVEKYWLKRRLLRTSPGAGHAGTAGSEEKTMTATPHALATAVETRPVLDPLATYELNFGALPAWFDEISSGAARSLALHSLRRGTPLTPADDLYQ
jgi:hypothetical protein